MRRIRLEREITPNRVRMDMYRKEHERIDLLSDCDAMILQDPHSFCFGMDAVLLSYFSTLKAHDHICEFGTGTGIVPIILSRRNPTIRAIAFEIQKDTANMAHRSVLMNGFQHQISILHEDFCRAEELFGPGSFDLVIANPPYGARGHGLINPIQEKALARHELTVSLEQWLFVASRLLKTKGRLAMVYKPQRLPELIVLLKKHRLEPKRLIFIQSFARQEPHLIFLESVKDAGSELRVEPTCIIYEDNGSYTKELLNIYKGAGRFERRT